jgi:hypothetical protein
MWKGVRIEVFSLMHASQLSETQNNERLKRERLSPVEMQGWSVHIKEACSSKYTAKKA